MPIVTPTIEHHHVASRGRLAPVVAELPNGGEAIVIHSVGNLAMSWDHRAFDGAYAARFLVKAKDILESRDWEAEL